MDMIRHENILANRNRMTLRGTRRLVKGIQNGIVSQQRLFLPSAECHKINRIGNKDLR